MLGTDDTSELAALRAFHRIVLLVNSEDNLADVLQAAAQCVVEVIGFRAVVVNLLTPRDDFEVVTVLGAPRDALLGVRIDREMFLAELAGADVWGELRFVPEGRQRALSPHAVWIPPGDPVEGPDAWQREDALYAPLVAYDGELVGILSVDLPRDGRRPDLVRRTLLEMYAVQIGLAISHARDRQRLDERLRLSSATNEVLHLATSTERLDDILTSSIDPLLAGYRGERVWIRLFAESDGSTPAEAYPPPAPGEAEPPRDSTQRLVHECWAARRTLQVSAGGADAATPGTSRQPVLDWLRSLGHEHLILVPLGTTERCLGYLAISRNHPGDWSDAEQDASLDVGRELGSIIITARLRTRESELVRRLEELDAYKTRVVTTIIHELKNPLAMVLGNLELADAEPEVASRAHAAIGRATGRMQHLVGDLLTLIRLRNPSGDLNRMPTDVSAVVTAVAAIVADQAEMAGVQVDVAGVQPAVVVRGDPSELERMVLNLVSNAIKYSSPGDAVVVSLTDGAQEAEFRCTDSGMGIASEDIPSIFEEFERSSNPAARSKPGSGLGLPIARHIAQRHGGSIEVTSQLGLGSSFLVRLPH